MSRNRASVPVTLRVTPAELDLLLAGVEELMRQEVDAARLRDMAEMAAYLGAKQSRRQRLEAL